MHPQVQQTGLHTHTRVFPITKLCYKYRAAFSVMCTFSVHSPLCVWCALTCKDDPVHPIFHHTDTREMSNAWQMNTASYLLFRSSIIKRQVSKWLEISTKFHKPDGMRNEEPKCFASTGVSNNAHAAFATFCCLNARQSSLILTQCLNPGRHYCILFTVFLWIKFYNFWY